ncbi:MAG: hypothetical protein IPL20_03065 [Saprospiraceae bacterium]|nr:hypothetical protein [Saprospiraceae bacterium]
MYFKDIKYLGGLPYPFNQVGSVDILLNDTVSQLVIKQGSKIYTLPIQNIYKVHVESDHDRSPSRGIVGYIIGSMIGKKSGLLGAAYGARKKTYPNLSLCIGVITGNYP